MSNEFLQLNETTTIRKSDISSIVLFDKSGDTEPRIACEYGKYGTIALRHFSDYAEAQFAYSMMIGDLA